MNILELIGAILQIVSSLVLLALIWYWWDRVNQMSASVEAIWAEEKRRISRRVNLGSEFEEVIRGNPGPELVFPFCFGVKSPPPQKLTVEKIDVVGHRAEGSAYGDKHTFTVEMEVSAIEQDGQPLMRDFIKEKICEGVAMVDLKGHQPGTAENEAEILRDVDAEVKHKVKKRVVEKSTTIETRND